MSLTSLDAFEIPVICHDVGYSVGAIAMLDSLGEVKDALATTVAKLSHYFMHWGPGVGRQIVDLEGRLTRCGFSPPPRWSTVPQYAEWSFAIVKAVNAAPGAEPAPRALTALGHNLGLLTRTAALYSLILRLEATSPQHEGVLNRSGRRRDDFLRFVHELVAAANHPELPAHVRPIAEQLARVASAGQQMAESPSVDGPASLAAGLENIHSNLREGAQALRAALDAQKPKARLSQLDAFMIPLICCDVGIPFSGQRLVSTLGAVQGPLAERVGKYLEMYRSKGSPFVAQQTADVESRLTRCGLAAPPRPNTFEEFSQWYLAVVKTLTSAITSQSPEWALVFLGDRLGQMMLKLALHIVFGHLRAVDPQHEVLRSDEAWSRERLYTDVKTLAGLAEQLQPILPPCARAYALELASQARTAQIVDEVPEPGGPANQAFRLEFVQAKLFETIFALRAALSDRSTVVMNPIGFI